MRGGRSIEVQKMVKHQNIKIKKAKGQTNKITNVLRHTISKARSPKNYKYFPIEIDSWLVIDL
jgi:hypothetical protein